MTPTLTIRLLGNVSIQRGDRAVTGLPSRKAEALLIYLVCTRRAFAREVLADWLWDDRSQEQAQANLRSILSGLRRAVGDYLVTERDAVAFNTDGDYWLDTEAFERQIADSRLLMADGQFPATDEPSAIRHLQSAIDLYRGDFLAGFHIRESRGFEEWATLERERLHRLAVTGLHRLVRHALDHGEYAAGVEHAARLLALDPLSEDAHRWMMGLLARSGQRSAALTQYAACRRILAEELDVSPTAETVALAARIRSAGAPGAHNLPPPFTEFVGRTKELSALQRNLARPDCRLLTLVGPGGIGKTRLAIEAARTLAVQQPGLFLHGIRFVALTGIDAAPLLAPALLDALGAPGSHDPQDSLLTHLREQELLLVLDNFEHLLGDGASADLLSNIVQHAPLVKLLVTSRERLRLREEWLFDVSGLEVPPSPQHPSPFQGEGPGVRVEDYSAMRLFVSNARRVRHDFDPPGSELHAISRICRTLDGAPLGIELAAAAVRETTCAEMADALRQNLDALTTSLRNVPERQRSLRAAFEHSWTLLPQALRMHFARLSIFPDTFSGHAASAVAEVDVRALDALAGKSLLQRLPDDRFQIHSLLRQYAAEKLSSAPEAHTAMGQRHAAYFIDFVAGQGTGIEPHQRAALRLEMANVRAAWQWAARRQDHDSLARALGTLHEFYSAQSWFQEGIDAFRFALDQLAAPSTATPERASIMCDLIGRKARMTIHIGQIDTARSDLEAALDQLRHVDDPDRRSTILGYLAITHYYAGDYGRATELAEESLRIAESIGSRLGIAAAVNFLGSCAKAQGDYDTARACFERAVDVYRAVEDSLGEAMVLNNLGNLAQARGDYASAQRHYRDGSVLFLARDHLHGAATMLANAGRLAIRQAAFDEARQLLEESLSLKRSIDDQRGMAVALVSLGDVSTASGAFDAAREQLTQALTLAQQSGDMQLVLDGLVAVAGWSIKRDRPSLAARLLAFALAHKATSQEAREQAEELVGALGNVPGEASRAAQQWAREYTIAEVVAEVLSQMAAA
jgi:predicted ATPase/DNA-binding SARP family transcriptional activator